MPKRISKVPKARSRKSAASKRTSKATRQRLTKKSKAQLILERLAISETEFPNVYWIGRKAMRLTFLSQQQRALNLIWALNKTGTLRAGSRVTVVGAGLAGLTAAFAARQLGASVTLLEAKQVPLHLQLGCWLRFVHPHILNWPQKDSENPLTDLPCLNWGADMAARVCNTVLEQWRAVEKTVKCYYGYEVRKISNLQGRYPLVFAEGTVTGENILDEGKAKAGDGRGDPDGPRKIDEPRGNYEEACDCLILSVGFGLEKPLPSVPFLSYWENDNFGRPLITGPIPRRYLVTGCGDGGLIDAIRLSLNAFDHADFVYALSNMEGLERTKDALLEIDESVAKMLRSDRVQLRIQKRVAEARARVSPGTFDEPRAKKRIEIDIQGELLEERYRSLEIPSQLKELITKRLRQDTTVYLNSPSTSPLSLGASILNRFVVFLLHSYGFLRYRAGEVEVLPIRSGQPIHVVFHHEQFPKEELEIHELVVRHGPLPAIDRLFPAPIVADARLLPEDFEDPTREPQYQAKDKFLDLPLLARQKERVYQDYALASTWLAARKFFTVESFDRFGVEVVEGKVSFYRRATNQQIDSSEEASYLGFTVRSDPPVKKQTPPTPTVRQVSLVSGVGIRNIGQKSRSAAARRLPKESFGTLACFVRLKDGRKALLTSIGRLGGSQIELTDQIVLAGKKESKQADVIATIRDFRMPKPSSPQSSVAAGTVEYNQFQAAIAVLEKGAKPQIGFGKAYAKLPQLKYDPATSGTKEETHALAKVFKVGAMTGLTRGVITNVLASVALQWGEELYWYENLFTVSSSNSKPFALAGDGGALIVRNDGTILGMIMGGDEAITCACPIKPVFTAFDCQPILNAAELLS